MKNYTEGDFNNTSNSIREIQKKHKLSGDKFKYSNYYCHLFGGQFRESVENVLEIGVASGSSLILWREFFPNIKHIVGIDNLSSFFGLIDSKLVNDNDDYKLYKSTDGIIDIFIMDAYNNKSLKIIKDNVPDMDIIMDDGPHTIESWKFFMKNYDSLSSKGIVLIEDVSCQEELSKNDKYHFVSNTPSPYTDRYEIVPDGLWFDTAESLYVHDKRKGGE